MAQKEGAAQVNFSAAQIIRKGSDVLRVATGAVYSINRPSGIPITDEEIGKKKKGAEAESAASLPGADKQTGPPQSSEAGLGGEVFEPEVVVAAETPHEDHEDEEVVDDATPEEGEPRPEDSGREEQ